MYNSEISAKLNEITLKNNIPVSATLELTYRCPLKCIHCYIPQGDRVSSYVKTSEDREGRGCSGSPLASRKECKQKELSTEEWKKILEELSEAGCLYIVFTGGEPLLREDLPELCRYATHLNFDIRIFTTGIREHKSQVGIKEFKNTNISKFEMSFYGRREIHNKITQNPDSFDITLEFAKKLKDAGFKVKLKTSLMKENWTEINYIKKLAGENNFEYSFDSVIAPGNNGDKSNLKHRLNIDQIKDVAAGLPSNNVAGVRLRRMQFANKSHSNATATKFDFFCGAGKNLVGINPYGDVYPCIQLPVSCGNVKENTFAKIWKNSRWLKKWRKMSMADVKICSVCSLLNRCNRCPGLALLEDGDLFGPSSLACKLTNQAKM